MPTSSPLDPAPLHPVHGPCAPAVLASRLARRGSWCGMVEHVPGERRFSRLDVDGAEAWVISWAPGTGLGLHDHGGAAGALVVVQGSLVEQWRTGRDPDRLRTHRLTTGSVVAFDADHVHEVTNRDAEPAVSIHVYAPSLERMTFFGADPRDDREVVYAPTPLRTPVG
ncbi:MAG: cysteine dioxygenase [Acidimicrobiales bacterium]